MMNSAPPAFGDQPLCVLKPANPWAFLLRANLLTLALLLALLAWDASGFDLPLAHWAGSSQGFALRDNRLWVLALHELPRALSMVLLVSLLIAVAAPWGFLKGLAMPDRCQMAFTALGGIALSTWVKRLSDTSCPWDLLPFGGTVPYVSHWALDVLDGGPGHCFPAGHASAAFGFVGAWFVLRRTRSALARWWLPAALATGLVLGVAQQMRGAHFMSHTLWTALICWSFGLAWECARTAWHAWRAAVHPFNPKEPT